MITISEICEKEILKKPFLIEFMLDGLINYSSLARMLVPEIQKQCSKDVTDASVLMALKRLNTFKVKRNTKKISEVFENMGEISIRNKLMSRTYANSLSIYKQRAKIMDATQVYTDTFLTLSQGISETTFVYTSSLDQLFDGILKKEELLGKVECLGSITMKLPEENNVVAGIYYRVLKQLAFNNINIYEIISTTREFTIIVHESSVSDAFNVIQEL